MQIPNPSINPGGFPKNDFEILIGVPVFKFNFLVFSKVKIIVRNNKFFGEPFLLGEKKNLKHK